LVITDKNRGYVKKYIDGKWETDDLKLINLLVNEIVEQALVDNLLDGDFYSSNDIELLNTSNHVNHVNSLPQTTTTTMTRLETNNLDVNNLDNHIGIHSANGDVASSINSK
jgi:hypothetical protein